MLCVEIWSDCNDGHIIVSCDCSTGIDVNSDTSQGIIVDSDSCDHIIVDSSLVKELIVSAIQEAFIDIDSWVEGTIHVSSDFTNGIFVYSDTDLIIVDSNLDNGIIVDSHSTGKIDVCAVYEPEEIDVSGFALDPMLVYSSYVCTITKDGYLIIENMFGDTDPPEPITIFIIGNSYNEIKVNSNLNWII